MSKVSYDSRAVTIDGVRTLILSGAIHYPRSTPAMWPHLMKLSREGGLNTVETYVFWNLHERQRRQYDFTGRLDLRHYCEVAAREGLSVILRIGPYVCAETNYGGFPSWLRDERGMVMRTWNEPFMREMEIWCRYLIDYVRPLLASNGGPIIMVQFENEYNNISTRYGEAGQKYLQWCVELGESLKIDVPLIMCSGGVEGAIETLNGFYLHEQLEEHFRQRPGQPALSTEFYPGWYETWGYPRHTRASVDLAYALMRFIAAGGSGVNYYMWHGGTNFGRECMYLQTATYDLDSPLDETGLPTTKYHHMARFHRLLAEYADVLLGQDCAQPKPVNVRASSTSRPGSEAVLAALGGGMPGEFVEADGSRPKQMAFEYVGKNRRLVFLCNDDKTDPAKIEYEGAYYDLAPLSVVVIAGGRVCLDTSLIDPDDQVSRALHPMDGLSGFVCCPEPLPGSSPQAFWKPVKSPHPVEQLQFTHDQSDYCWYRADLVVVSSQETDEGVLFLAGAADYVHVFVDGIHKASTPLPLMENRNLYPASDALGSSPIWEPVRTATFGQSFAMSLPPGRHRLEILCCSLGLIKGDWMLGMHNMVHERKGLWAPVSWNGVEITGWEIRPYLLGELADRPEGAGEWFDFTTEDKRGMRWWRSTFPRPVTGSKLVLDMGGMTKGFIYLNGHCLSRYWLLSGAGTDPFDKYRFPVVSRPSAKPTQRYYHVPGDWLKDENTLVLFEECGGEPSMVKLLEWK